MNDSDPDQPHSSGKGNTPVDGETTDEPAGPPSARPNQGAEGSDVPFMAKLVTEAADDPSVAKSFGKSADGDTGESLLSGPEVNAGGAVRVGSPFREDPVGLGVGQSRRHGRPSGEAAYAEFGPFIYTSMGASVAAVVVLFFALIGCWWFPAGGVLVTMLGAVLSIVGLFSVKRFRLTAIAALPLHIILFFMCYVRTLS